MVNSENKIQFIPLFVGLIVLFLLGYIVKILLPPEYQIFLYIFAVIIIVCIVIITYFCIKNSEFREKTLSVIKKLFAGISKLGFGVLKNMEEGERKGKKKKRIQITDVLKNKVHDIAADKCQVCGRRGGLEIHHIDKDRTNYRITNLVLLCGNHHNDADKGEISKWRLKNIRKKQATHTHIHHQK